MRSSDIWAVLNADKMQKERHNHPRFNDEFETTEGKIIVDTCYVADCGYYETGVNRKDTWYIVQKNIIKGDLKSVHDKWVTKMKKKPDMLLRDMHNEDGDVLE